MFECDIIRPEDGNKIERSTFAWYYIRPWKDSFEILSQFGGS